MKITDVEIDNKVKPDVSGKYYVKMEWMFGDANGYGKTVAGPFPENKKDLLIEFLNILQNMINLYSGGKCGWDNYEEIEGYELYFDEDFCYEDKYPNCSKNDLKLQKVRDSVDAQMPCGEMGTIPTLISVKAFYRDRNSNKKHKVNIKTDTGKTLKFL